VIPPRGVTQQREAAPGRRARARQTRTQRAGSAGALVGQDRDRATRSRWEHGRGPRKRQIERGFTEDCKRRPRCGVMRGEKPGAREKNGVCAAPRDIHRLRQATWPAWLRLRPRALRCFRVEALAILEKPTVTFAGEAVGGLSARLPARSDQDHAACHGPAVFGFPWRRTPRSACAPGAGADFGARACVCRDPCLLFLLVQFMDFGLRPSPGATQWLPMGEESSAWVALGPFSEAPRAPGAWGGTWDQGEPVRKIRSDHMRRPPAPCRGSWQGPVRNHLPRPHGGCLLVLRVGGRMSWRPQQRYS